MANPSVSLARSVDRQLAAKLLGLDGLLEITPAECSCPFCPKKTLIIYHDLALSADWLACHSCGFAGDLIEFAAKVWKCDVNMAARRLQAEGAIRWNVVTDAALASYHRDHIGYRQRVNQFWDHAVNERYGCDPSSLLRSQRNARLSENLKGWHRGCELLGVATRTEVEDLYVPASMTPRERLTPSGKRTLRRGSGAGKRRPLPGTGWAEVLVLPFYDLPGRISGFVFGQSPGGEEITDWRARFLNLGPCSAKPKPVGWTNLAVFFQNTDRWLGDSLFVIVDINVATRLSLDALQTALHALPITSVIYDLKHYDYSLLDQLPEWNATVASDYDYVRSLDLARLLSARFLSSHDLAVVTHTSNPINMIARNTLASIRRWALPADQITENSVRLRKTTMRTRQRPLSEMTFTYPVLVGPPAEQSPPVVPPEPRAPLWSPHVFINGRDVLERDGLWADVRAQEPVVNAIPRIDRIRVCRYRETLLCGRVIFPRQGTTPSQTVTFAVPQTQVARQGLFPVLQTVCRQHGQNFTFKRSWAKDSELLTSEFQRPIVQADADVIGYHAPSQSFRFPVFALRQGGDIVTDDAVDLADRAGGVWDLAPPDDTAWLRERLAALSATGPETRLIWAVAGLTAYQALTPVWALPPLNVAVEGTLAQTVVRDLVRWMGGLEFDVPNHRQADRLEHALRQFAERHPWPTWLQPAENPRLPLISGLRQTMETGNLWLPVDFHSARIAEFRGHVVLAPRARLLPESTAEAVRPILPSFLRYVCQNQAQTRDAAKTGVEQVFVALASWFASLGGRRETVLSGRDSVRSPQNQRSFRAMVRLVCRLCDDGNLAVVDRSATSVRAKRSPAIVRPGNSKDPYEIPIPSVLAGLRRARVVLPTADELIRAGLTHARVSLQDTSSGPILIVPVDAWNEALPCRLSAGEKADRVA